MPQASLDHLRLAGFALAHAVWSIEDGETLCTMAMVDDGQERRLTRFEADSIPESIEMALATLKEHLTNNAVAALVYDGYHTDDEGDRRDALIVEMLVAQVPGPSGNTAAHLGRLVQRYMPAKRSLLTRGRVALIGKPLALGAFPEDAPDIVLAGAVEHEKVRGLFQAAS